MAREDFKDVLREAKALFDAGRLGEASDLLEGSIPEEARDGRLLTFLAYLRYKLGDLPAAREIYLRLTGLEPDNLSVWSNLGLVSLKLGLLEDARGAFETYLARKPDDARVREYLGAVCDRLGPRAEEGRAAAPAEAAGGAPAASAGGTEGGEASPHPSAAGGESPGGAGHDAVPLKEWIRLFQEEEAVASSRYMSLSSHLLAVRLEHRLIFALPALTLYQGITVFGQGPNPYGRIPRAHRSDDIILMSAEGNGILWLTHDAGWLVTLGLDAEALCLNAHRLVAFDSSVECEWLPLGKERFLPGLAALRLSGRGRVVLAPGGGMVSTGVRPGTSLYLRPASVVAWTDGLRADADGGEDLKKVKGFFDGPFLRFEGSGRVFVAGGTGRS